MSDAVTERLKTALRAIESDVNWFFACGGAMMGIIRDVRKRVDAVRADIFEPDPDASNEPAPLDNNF